MKSILGVALALAVGLALSYNVVDAGGAVEAKYTNKEVMQQAHKKGLLKKVLGGDASKADAAKLLDLYMALWHNEPEKGSAESWKEKTGNLIVAAGHVVIDGKTALEGLKAASNCKGCHSEHK